MTTARPIPADEAWPAASGATQRKALFVVLAIAAGGWLLRALPLMRSGGTFGYPVDYDEGVYFASSALLFRGVLPYRDFAFVHPPGLLYFLAPTAWLSILRDPAFAFGVARWLAALVGCANVFLSGRLAMRLGGPIAAIAAAAIYATHPKAVWVERGPFLEPVLNLCCLCLASVWLGKDDPDRARWRMLAAGALCGLAASVKLWGALWLVACLLSLPSRQWRRDATAFAAAAAAAWVLLTLPIAFSAPANFWEQVISFHLHRPPDGPIGRLSRLASVLWTGAQLPKSLLVISGFVLALIRAREVARRAERFYASAFFLILAGFLASSTYWSQYNAHLAVAESGLAGYAAAALWNWSTQGRIRSRVALTAVFLIAVPALSAWRSIFAGRASSPELIAVGQFIRSAVPPDSCLVAFEPSWSIVGGRLPDRLEGRPRVVDSYAMMLLDATRAGQRFTDATHAFRDPASQSSIRAALAACRFAVVGDRGHWQMSPETQQWLQSQFVQRFPPLGMEGIDVWERAL